MKLYLHWSLYLAFHIFMVRILWSQFNTLSLFNVLLILVFKSVVS